MSLRTDVLNPARQASSVALRGASTDEEPPMNLEVRARGLNLTEAHRAQAVRRMLFALGRFERQVEGVILRMDDVNGPRRGSDKRFQISARLLRGETVRIEGRHEDVYGAINQAADRLGRAVARVLARRRDLIGGARSSQPA
jgi:putative sigma-54 modulation protein